MQNPPASLVAFIACADAMLHMQTTPYGHQQQLLPSLLTAQQEAGTAAPAMAPACLVSQDPGRDASGARNRQATDVCEEENTMCLRDQLISSRCTEQR